MQMCCMKHGLGLQTDRLWSCGCLVQPSTEIMVGLGLEKDLSLDGKCEEIEFKWCAEAAKSSLFKLQDLNKVGLIRERH